MSKKTYQKPAMKVVPFQHQTHLLTGSGGETPNNYDDVFSYMPGTGPSHLA